MSCGVRLVRLRSWQTLRGRLGGELTCQLGVAARAVWRDVNPLLRLRFLAEVTARRLGLSESSGAVSATATRPPSPHSKPRAGGPVTDQPTDATPHTAQPNTDQPHDLSHRAKVATEVPA